MSAFPGRSSRAKVWWIVAAVLVLFVGTLADIYGIPRVTLFAAVVIIVLAVLNYLNTGSPRRYGPASSSRTSQE